MSLATRCTSCGTVFRVVQDQLKVSEGWVRCGRCQQVFNALEALFDLEREAPPPRPAPPPVSPGTAGVTEFVSSLLPPADPDEPLPETQDEDAIESRFFAPPPTPARRGSEPPEFADARFPSELPLDDDAPPPAAPPDAAPPAAPRATPLLERWRARREARRAAAGDDTVAAPPPLAAAPPDDDDADGDDSVFDTEFLPGDESMLRGELPAAANGGDEQVELATMRELVAPSYAAVPKPAFVRAAEKAERWKRPRVRASLALAALLLLGTLAAQVAVQFRDAFAARWPEARPALLALCDVLGCEIGPLRRLAALAVAGSGLAPGGAPDSYRLSLTLHNRDEVALATPSVELSLTDARGRLIARRVLAPGELKRVPGDAPLGSRLEAATETQAVAVFSVRERAVSGYTVELFYP
jgi:predicted Zn finger-like uncharacterized protein